MSKKGAALQQDVPWRASSAAKPIPKIHHSPVLRLPQNPYSDYALSVMKVCCYLISDYIRIYVCFIYSSSFVAMCGLLLAFVRCKAAIL